MAHGDEAAYPEYLCPSRYLLQLENAEHVWIVQMKCRSRPPPLSDSEYRVEMPLDRSVEAGGIETSDQVGAIRDGFGHQVTV